MHRRSILNVCVVILVPCAIYSELAGAGDWPQILGPDRNGIAVDERLAASWPETGPQLLWSRPVGQGTAGVAVIGETAILFHRPADEEVVEALDVRSGQPKWQKSYPTTFSSQVGGDDGPLCVPTVSGERIVTFGPQGVLCCWGVADGTLHWRRETHEDFDAQEGYFGAGSSPLVDDGRVIVNVGGAKAGAGIVAFDLQTGATLWQATDERASYSAPTVAVIDGRRVVLCLARLTCVGLDSSTGQVLFQVPCGRRGPTVNAATPVLFGKRFLLTSSYGVGAIFAEITGDSAQEIWRNAEVLSSQYTTPIASEGAVFGIDGREDIPPAHLRCLDPQTGRVLWSEDNFGYATLIRAGDKLLIVKTNGELVLAAANRERFEPLSQHQLTPRTLRALPALSNGRLLVRDEDTLYCVKVGRP